MTVPRLRHRSLLLKPCAGKLGASVWLASMCSLFAVQLANAQANDAALAGRIVSLDFYLGSQFSNIKLRFGTENKLYVFTGKDCGVVLDRDRTYAYSEHNRCKNGANIAVSYRTSADGSARLDYRQSAVPGQPAFVMSAGLAIDPGRLACRVTSIAVALDGRAQTVSDPECRFR